MIIETIKTEKKLFNFNHPKSYTYLSLALFMATIIVILINKEYFKIRFITNFLYPISFLSSIIFGIAQLFTLFSKEDILIRKTGKIKITADSFIINKEIISFKDIVSINIDATDYEGRLIGTQTSIKPMYSIGVNNFIKFTTRHNKFEQQILISSFRESKLIYNFLSQQIIKNKFLSVSSRQLISIFRDEFKKTEEARNYIAVKIKERKLNKTEGLLMMNYSSDKEVKELRKKYTI